MDTFNINEILKILPHRYPFLLLDKIIHFVPNESIVAIKNVTINEPFFTGHFPEIPIMPGVMILEALAQACGILAYKANAQEGKPSQLIYFAGIEEARFKKIVRPGDQLVLNATMQKMKRGIWKCQTHAMVDNEEACTAVLLGAIKDNNSDT